MTHIGHFLDYMFKDAVGWQFTTQSDLFHSEPSKIRQ